MNSAHHVHTTEAAISCVVTPSGAPAGLVPVMLLQIAGIGDNMPQLQSQLIVQWNRADAWHVALHLAIIAFSALDITFACGVLLATVLSLILEVSGRHHCAFAILSIIFDWYACRCLESATVFIKARAAADAALMAMAPQPSVALVTSESEGGVEDETSEKKNDSADLAALHSLQLLQVWA